MEEMGIGIVYLARPWLAADKWLFGRNIPPTRELKMSDSSFFKWNQTCLTRSSTELA